MKRIAGGVKAWGLVLLTGALAACATEPRYSIYADPAPAPNTGFRPVPYAAPVAPAPSGEGVRGATDPRTEAPPNATAPVASIEGGALDAPPSGATPTYLPPTAAPSGADTTGAGVSYVIQPGDTISGIGRRFRASVQSLIDLNGLGPRAAITPGQSLILPASAVETGTDPYATGPSPIGVLVAETAETPPPPAVPRPAEVVPTPRTTAAPPTAPATADLSLGWPIRGDVLRRFGPAGIGERNNGVNIGGTSGQSVVSSAAGQVGYVGDDLAGQGLTVLIVHPQGWRTVYGHLGSTTVKDGDRVTSGQTIGTVGTSAGDGRPSVHYEIWRMRGDEPVAVDPLTVLPR